jgi:methyl-accepting chemotaxis protein
MKVKFRLGFWVIIITAVVVTGITILLLRQTSGISYYLSIRSLGNLTSQRVEFWKGQEEGHVRTLHTLANLMGDYENIKAAERRDLYDDMLRSALQAEPQMAALYTVWKPNVIDEMDSLNIGRTGSSPSGQYATVYIRETGKIAGHTSGDIDNVMAHITGHNARKDRVENPTVIKIKGKNTFIIKMTVPITNHRTNEVVGGLGCFLVIDTIQNMIENTMKTNNEISMMAMYSGNGTILAHLKADRVGKRMIDVDEELGDSRQEMLRAMQTGKPYMNTVHDPALKENIIFIMKPFQIGDSGHNWSMLIGVSESYVLKEVKTVTGFAIMLAVTAILVMAIIIFVIFGIITKPIVRVTDMLKDISEGKGDLTRILIEEGNDEITDMSHYFNLTMKKIKNMIINIKQQAAALSDTGNELSGNMTQTAAIITQIIADLKNIKNRLIDQNLSAAQTEAIMEQITKSIDKFKEHVEQQASNTVQSSSAVEENISRLNEITQEVKQESAEIQGESHEAALESRYLELVNEEISADIDEIAAGTNQINTVLTRVNEISKRNRTNIDLLVSGVSMYKVA